MSEVQNLAASCMEYHSIDCGRIPATANVSHFAGRDGVDEFEIVCRPIQYASIEQQLEWISQAYSIALNASGLGGGTAILRRFYCSDLSNQVEALDSFPFANATYPDEPCAISWVRQPPVPPVKVAMFAYHIRGKSRIDKCLNSQSLTVERGSLVHHWTTNLHHVGSTSFDQAWGILERYDAFLQERAMTLRDHTVRTWFYVQNVDSNYEGLVRARREFFAQRGLTHETHYIASTGIEGAHHDLSARVSMDAYAIAGLEPAQVKYLSALDHLSPTYLYGVTFERGTSITYRDRTHAIISGTASIDSKGQIVHPGNVRRQLDRTLENVEALLQDAGAGLHDMSSFIVYVRDPSDHQLAWDQMRSLFGNAPVEVVVAPVCRPGWLIEIEGRAIVPADEPHLPEF